MSCRYCKNLAFGLACDECGEKSAGHCGYECAYGDGSRPYDNSQMCGAKSGSEVNGAVAWVCTLPVGHSGPHIACAGQIPADHNICIWT